MKPLNIKRFLYTVVLFALSALFMTACGGTKEDADNPEALNTDNNQTEFEIMGGMSALSHGYTDNVVLNQLMEETGVKITWNTISDSVGEQVNIRIAGGELPTVMRRLQGLQHFRHRVRGRRKYSICFPWNKKAPKKEIKNFLLVFA